VCIIIFIFNMLEGFYKVTSGFVCRSGARVRATLWPLGSVLCGALLLLGPGAGGVVTAEPSGPAPASAGPFRWLPANVIGRDERRPADAGDMALLRAVGIVVCARSNDSRPAASRATGSLVGDRRTVLTAAHVFADESLRSGRSVRFDPVDDCSFRQYDSDGEMVSETRFVSAVFGAYRHDSGRPTEDWAVLRTAATLPESSLPLRFAGLSVDDLPPDNPVSIAVLAFHADRRTRRRAPLLSEGELFAVDYAGFRRLAHTADMGRMSSGAAIVHRFPDGQVVAIGVHRSAATHGDYNLAVPIAGELEAALSAATSGDYVDAGERLAFARGPWPGNPAVGRWTAAR